MHEKNIIHIYIIFMKRILFNSFTFILVILLFSACYRDKTNIRGGVVLTFDDRYVSDWIWADSMLSDLDWKATFCVYGVDGLNASQFQQLRDLKSNGHEIAGHGMDHLNAVEYVSSYGLSEYISHEIEPMIDIMDNEDLHPKSFAYPYGTFNESINKEMLKYFNTLRSTTYGIKAPEDHQCYYNNDPLVYGLGLDTYSSHFDPEFFLRLLEYAKINNKIVIFYSHRPVEAVTRSNQTDINTLLMICEYVKANHMKFYTLSDLTPYMLLNEIRYSR